MLSPFRLCTSAFAAWSFSLLCKKHLGAWLEDHEVVSEHSQEALVGAALIGAAAKTGAKPSLQPREDALGPPPAAEVFSREPLLHLASVGALRDCLRTPPVVDGDNGLGDSQLFPAQTMVGPRPRTTCAKSNRKPVALAHALGGHFIQILIRCSTQIPPECCPLLTRPDTPWHRGREPARTEHFRTGRLERKA